MLHANLLKTHAPDSPFLLFHPQDTGSPGQDFCHHLTRHSHRRIELEDTMLVGDNCIVRIEPDLGSPDDREAKAKIVTLRYAERVLGSGADAAEFIRCVKLLAGEDARGRDLQLIASYYYGEARRRPAGEVLKEMAMWALLEAWEVKPDDERYGYSDINTHIEICKQTIAALEKQRSEIIAELEKRVKRYGVVLEERGNFGKQVKEFNDSLGGLTEAKQEIIDAINEEFEPDNIFGDEDTLE